ncbi:MAG: ribonuclease PH [Anaerolineales bacterium]|nr:ribonuclease PH [Anaerolineales bacterium]
MDRIDGRALDELRPIQIQTGFSLYPEGSVLISFGATKVLCNVTIETSVPVWLRESGVPSGWITAEYALLPRSTQQRVRRETMGLRGRTQEVKRFIGRSLRAAFNLELLESLTCIVDCDVLQADGGTRTASVTGGYIALRKALAPLVENGTLPEGIFLPQAAAISVGMIDHFPLLDLNYHEDSSAQVDMNIVMNTGGAFIEIQGTAEQAPFTPDELQQLLDLAGAGCRQLFTLQNQALGLPAK